MKCYYFNVFVIKAVMCDNCTTSGISKLMTVIKQVSQTLPCHCFLWGVAIRDACGCVSVVILGICG